MLIHRSTIFTLVFAAEEAAHRPSAPTFSVPLALT
jgi:hypothetical protein